MASNLNLSEINKYVDESSSQIVSAAILEPKMLSLVNVQSGIKYKSKLRLSTRNLVYQTNSGCLPQPAGDYSLLDKEVEVKPIIIREQICLSGADTIEQYWPGQFMKAMGSNNQELPSPVLDNYITETMAQVAKNNNLIAYQGNTGLTSSNLSKADGWLTQFKADAEVRVYGATSGTASFLSSSNAISIVNAVVEAGSEDIIEMADRVIPMSPKNFQVLVDAYYASNNYHFDVTEVKNTGEFWLPTHDVRVMRDPGLSGSKEFFYTTLSNLVVLCDLENEHDNIRMIWDEVDQALYTTIKFKFGVSYYFGDYVVRYTGIPA